MKVCVLRGGRSSEHDVSLQSGAAVADGLRAAGHEVVGITLGRDGGWRDEEGHAVKVEPGRGLLHADVVFPALHGPFGEDGTVQGLLEILDVPYVGSGVLASAACMDKVVFKDLMAVAGMPQVEYALVVHGPEGEPRSSRPLEELGFPCWVKPACLGSSVGIVKVRDASEMDAALATAFEHDCRVIVEASARGLEVECSVLGPTQAPEVSEPGEIVIDGEWYDFTAKYTPGGMDLVVPARITDTARARVRELAAAAFTRAGCSGLARADFFVDGEDVLLNELNTMPGFTETSVYGKLWEQSGVEYPRLVERLCEIAIDRHAEMRALRS